MPYTRFSYLYIYPGAIVPKVFGHSTTGQELTLLDGNYQHFRPITSCQVMSHRAARVSLRTYFTSAPACTSSRSNCLRSFVEQANHTLPLHLELHTPDLRTGNNYPSETIDTIGILSSGHHSPPCARYITSADRRLGNAIAKNNQGGRLAPFISKWSNISPRIAGVSV
jgi:hypothetical protein